MGAESRADRRRVEAANLIATIVGKREEGRGKRK
jgi:hypothetical protein